MNSQFSSISTSRTHQQADTLRRKIHPYLVFAGLLVMICFLVCVTAYAQATEVVVGTFSTSGQNPWGTSPGQTAIGFGFFPLVNWNQSVNLGPGVSCFLGACAGAQLTLSTSGNALLLSNIYVSQGTVAATEPATFDVSYPTILPTKASTATVNSSMVGFGLGTLTTTPKTVSLSSSVLLSTYMGASGEACLVACVSGGTTLLSWTGNEPLVAYNQGGNGVLSVLGKNTPFTLGQVLTADNGIISLSVNNGPSTVGFGIGHIVSTGSSSVLGASANLTDIATGLLGMPPLNGSVGISGVASINYNLLTATLSLQDQVSQTFNLNPTGEYVDYHVLQTGANYIEPVGTPVNIPFGKYYQLDVTPTFFINASLSNFTSSCLDASDDITALGGSVSLLGQNIGFGPLVNQPDNFGCLGGNRTLFNDSFALAGWTSIQGQTFALDRATPEPTTLLLVGSGFLAFGGAMRRRQRKARA